MLQFKGLSASKLIAKQYIGKMCKEWKDLIENYELSLCEWIDYIEQKEIETHKTMTNKLNDELKLLKAAKVKCSGLLSFATIDDVFKFKQDDQNEDSKENIVSVVNQCVSKLDKSLVIPRYNLMEKLADNIVPFDIEQAQV